MKNISAEEFMNTLANMVQEHYGKEVQTTITPIAKNNGVIRIGMKIQQRGNHISPLIYMEDYVDQYKEGRPIEDIVKEIVGIYDENQVDNGIVEGFTDYEKMRDKIFVKLINMERNKTFLKNIPNYHFMDLAVVCYVKLQECEEGEMTTMIHNNHLRAWNIKRKELFRNAMENTRKVEKPQVMDMSKVLRKIAESMGIDSENIPEDMYDETIELYVLTNQSGYNGAVSFLLPDVLKNFADRIESDVVILPSSVHEVLLLKRGSDTSCEELKEMVQEINADQVAEEERLSNNIYIYMKDSGKISIVGESEEMDMMQIL